mmetsp:Transcript_16958/g.39519  ORF Transcript_16958/g.39519 Transcript_16958/m.39519 type:complete len:242 (-) Transcript_16958:3836-4561(-)
MSTSLGSLTLLPSSRGMMSICSNSTSSCPYNVRKQSCKRCELMLLTYSGRHGSFLPRCCRNLVARSCRRSWICPKIPSGEVPPRLLGAKVARTCGSPSASKSPQPGTQGTIENFVCACMGHASKRRAAASTCAWMAAARCCVVELSGGGKGLSLRRKSSGRTVLNKLGVPAPMVTFCLPHALCSAAYAKPFAARASMGRTTWMCACWICGKLCITPEKKWTSHSDMDPSSIWCWGLLLRSA